MQYGYVRVSSKEQNIDRQMTAMSEAGIPKKNIFIDKASGKDFKRRGYLRMLRRLKPEDEVFIKSIDRLGRNYDEIIGQWRKLTKEKEVNVVVLDFPLLDTRNQLHGLTGKFAADLVLQILSYVAQIERENTHIRQMEGIREAKKKGVRFGRPRQAIPENFEEVARQCRNGNVSLRKGAALLGVSHTTLAKWIKENKKYTAVSESCKKR